MTDLLSVDHLSFGFHDRQLYQDLTFNLKQGSMTSLIGANGVGKTTLIRLLMGQLHPQSGSINFMPDMKLGYVPQFRNIDPEYPLSIKSFVQLNQLSHPFPWHTKKRASTSRRRFSQNPLNGTPRSTTRPCFWWRKAKSVSGPSTADGTQFFDFG